MPGAPLMLTVTRGSAPGETIEVEEELEIGRAADGDGRLAGDIEISRRHARIVRQDDGSYVIEDLGSTNGTQVNGVTIESPQPLAPGDTVELGGTALLVEEAPTEQQPAEAGTLAPAPATLTGQPVEGPPVEGPPAEGPPAEAPPAPVRIDLQVEIDVEGDTATVWLDEGAVELEQRDGAWRLADRG